MGAALEQHASAARSPQRVISVHLTGFAPGCERLGIDNPRRRGTYWNRHPDSVVRSLLTRLDKAPAEVAVNTDLNGDVELLVTPPADLIPHLSTGSAKVPAAIIWEGLTASQLKDSLQRLYADRWFPPRKLEALAAEAPQPPTPAQPDPALADPEGDSE